MHQATTPSPDVPEFSQALRDASAHDWDACLQHRFVRELFDGTISDDAMRQYLVQDYQFIDRFVALLGAAIASSDQFESRVRLARFTHMITSEENTYFLRAFDVLGVSDQDRRQPVLSLPTQGFQALMAEAARTQDYASCLAVLTVAEWLYLSWADRPGAVLPANFIHAEWITLHDNPVFREFVQWLRAELDRVGATLDAARRGQAAGFFRRAVELERQFFDAVYLDC